VRELEPLQKQLEESKANVLQLQSASKSSGDKHASEMAERDKQIQALKAQVEQDRKAAADKLAEATKRSEDAMAEMKNYQGRVRELEPLQKQLEESKASVVQLQSANKASGDRHAGEIAEREKRLTQLQAQLDETQKQAEAASQQSDRRYQQAIEETRSYQERLKQLESTQEKLKESQAAVQQLQSQFKATEDRHNGEIKVLQQQLSQAEAAANSASEEQAKSLRVSEGKVNEISTELEALKQRMRDDAQAAEQKQKQAQSEIAGQQARLSELEPLKAELDALQQRNRALMQSGEQSEKAFRTKLADAEKRLEQLQGEQTRAAARHEEELKLLRELVGKSQRDAEQANQQRESDIAARQAQIAQLQSEVEKERKSAADERGDSSRKLQQAIAESRSFQSRIGQLEADREQLDQLEAESKRLQAQLKTASERHAAEIAELEAKLKSLQSLETELGRRDSRIAALERRIAELEAMADTRDADSRREIDRLQKEIERLRATPAPKVAAADAVERSSRRTADGKKTTRKDGQDDLKLIFGIGPKIEQMLNGDGVTRFEHIAAWKAAEVEKYSAMLDSFPDRIERDEWVKSAQQILDGTYNWTERKKARATAK
jgi:predicted flap endonuclease-1-like 5' DNA nuclease